MIGKVAGWSITICFLSVTIWFLYEVRNREPTLARDHRIASYYCNSHVDSIKTANNMVHITCVNGTGLTYFVGQDLETINQRWQAQNTKYNRDRWQQWQHLPGTVFNYNED